MKFTVLDSGCFKRAAMGFGDCAADSKTKSHASSLTGNKRLKEILAGRRGNTRSIVSDHNAHVAVIVTFHEDPYATVLAS